jgi:hypothetical protein
MVNPFEFMAQTVPLMFQSQGARFGWGPQETMRATAALMPAFLLGLRQQAPSPTDWLTFFQPERVRATDPLQLFFGVKPALNPIAEQAAIMSGINAKLLQEFMPMMAEALAKNISQNFTQFSPYGKTTETPAEQSGQALGEMIVAMMGLAPSKPDEAPEPEPVTDPIAQSVDAFAQMLATSREAQESHIKSMQSILSHMMGKP